MRSKSKQSISLIQRKIWKECRRLVFDRDNKDGKIDCYTCPAKNIVGSNRQLGHVPWPKATLSAFLKYDLRLLKYQCYHCNINCGGMGAEALDRMTLENGQEYIDTLKKDKLSTVKAMDHYMETLARYKAM